MDSIKLSQSQVFISYQDILNKYSQEQIFYEYLGYYPKTNKYYVSPLRKDTKAGCRFEYKNGWLTFIDNRGIFMNCFQMAMFLTGKDLNAVCLDIYNKNPYPLVVELSSNYRNFKCDIRTTIKKWEEDNYFTSNFDIDVDFLNEEPIFNVNNYWCNTKKDSSLVRNRFGIIKPTIQYYFPESKHTKLYFPLNKDLRWYSNATQEDIFNWHNINKFEGDTIIITKSGKDVLLLWHHLRIPVIGVQSEGIGLPQKVISFLNAYTNIIIMFDNDDAGINASQKLFKALSLLFPAKSIKEFFYMSGIKDTAEYYLFNKNLNLVKDEINV